MKWTDFDDINAFVLEFNRDFDGRRTFILVYNGNAYSFFSSIEGHILLFEDFLSEFNSAQPNLVAQFSNGESVFSEECQNLLNYDDFLLEELGLKLKISLQK